MTSRLILALVALGLAMPALSSTAQAKDPWKHHWKAEQKREKAYYKYERKQAKEWAKYQRKQARYWYR